MQKTRFLMWRVATITAVGLAFSSAAMAAGQDGQTVYKDPKSGKLRAPTAAEEKELNSLRAAQRASAVAERKASGAPQANVANVLKNGIVQAYLDEESISYSVMTRNAKGELVLQCVSGATAAKDTLAKPESSTTAKEHQHEVQ